MSNINDLISELLSEEVHTEDMLDKYNKFLKKTKKNRLLLGAGLTTGALAGMAYGRHVYKSKQK